jgi:SAM-dependent methyltransferase
MDLRTAVAVRVRRATTPFRAQHVEHDGVLLPARHLRPGGEYFQDDGDFVRSATAEADRLVEAFGIQLSSSVVDIGCGVGRLPLGLLLRLGEVSEYQGFDVDRGSTAWCQKYIAGEHPGCRFDLLNVRNARYNPDGAMLAEAFSLPVGEGTVDVAYMYSVFSHMVAEDVAIYLRELKRILRPAGAAFLTAFIETDVPSVSINPANYRRDWVGHLHCVRFERSYFVGLVDDAGLGVDRIDYGVETDGQCGVYLSPR